MKLTENQKRSAYHTMKRYQQNPIAFLTEVLDVNTEHVWSKMEDICLAVRDYQQVVVKASHSCSKTYTVGRIALWFLYCFYPSTVITTAPSYDQVEELLWREIRSAHANAKIPLGGSMLKTKLELDERWFAIGFATRPDTVTQQATRFHGYHNDNVLIVFDEAAGIMPQIWEARDGLLITERCKFIGIGNPTSSTGKFSECFHLPEYKKITISAYDTPNYKQGREVVPGLADKAYVERMKNKYGEYSNIFRSRVLGEIPTTDADALIQQEWIEAAFSRYKDYIDCSFKDPFPFTKRFITVDPADGGNDIHHIKAWNNKTEIDSITVRYKKVEEIEPYCWRMLRKIDGNAIIYDGDGMGRVLGGLLRSSSDKTVQVIPFEGSSQDTFDEKSFKYRYSEGHWQMRCDFEKNEIRVPFDEELKEELAVIKLDGGYDAKGCINVEKKDKQREYISDGRSPAKKDCVMMMSACFDQVEPISKDKDKYRIDHYEHSYNWKTA